jgi:septal ring-binding cell division protein DamX
MAAPTPPPVAVAPASTTVSGSARGNREFLSLPASNYVIELARGANRGDLAALRDSLHVPRGELYELHLTRDGGDWWVLVWASFDSLSAARAARSELPAEAAISVGWPRQIAPLQNEARRRPE